MSITIGSAATNRFYVQGNNQTCIVKNNPVISRGIIDTVNIWAVGLYGTMGGCKIGIFYNTGTNQFTARDNVTIGNVTAGSAQTFTGLSLACEIGDYIGIYFSSGQLECDTLTGETPGYWTTGGDQTACVNSIFSYSTLGLSVGGSGTVIATVPSGSLFFGMGF